ncbi:formylglycine-generating enzyme required for sulfatase activity [Dongia mobilis]|uniref:Formylglycine-generating enzyme required for sulfatase activity n=1 Tax=Dongia mobilis TaxID=578943 RepID=A0A4R6WSB0_9PROT|nr:SUMF1/EgtB/PvdO family nonheme iron enzyme [Dongia mobilis]TDQ84522.1 formylglycine-generating enzyme required for sulfatase activity [Dongia mobilis]
MLRLILAVFAVSWLSLQGAMAEPRLALVIGNSNYGQEMGRLANPANDAELMAATLQKLGFEVTRLVDADQKQMKRAIADFGSALLAAGPDAAGLFFYAGHGIQIAGENYLIPLKAEIEKEADAEIEAVSANWVLTQMEFAGNRINIVILDACRNNPMARSMRSASRGLARMDAPKGSFIAYSTAPGEVAADGDGRNSPYTAALAKSMLQPGIAIEETFRNTRVSVLQATGEKQVPWESSSLTGAFFFQAGSAPAAAAAPAPAQPAAQVAAVEPSATTKSLPAGVAAGAVIKDCPTCPELAALAPGRYRMGALDGERGSSDAERPQANIDVGAFAIGKYEVTRGEFAAFVAATGHRASRSCWSERNGSYDFIDGRNWEEPGFSQGDRDPVVCVTAEDAEAYVAWLTEATGKRYRLPSEAEWEYAARAGATGPYHWGSDIDDICTFGNITDAAAIRKFSGWSGVGCDDGKVYTAPVGSYQPNANGLHDVLGNVKEWVADCWNDDLGGIGPTAKARRSGKCSMRVVRGSAWDSPSQIARLAYREGNNAPTAYFNYGFRVARDF